MLLWKLTCQHWQSSVPVMMHLVGQTCHAKAHETRQIAVGTYHIAAPENKAVVAMFG
jgi:hypothetical protein